MVRLAAAIVYKTPSPDIVEGNATAEEGLKRMIRWGLVLLVCAMSGLAQAQTQTPAQAPVTLRVFAGGSGNRPDITRELLDRYQAAHPHLRVEVENGGATSELQRQYITTILGGKDASLDVFLMDVVDPLQYARMGWLEPLSPYYPGQDRAAFLQDYLPAIARLSVFQDKLIALPAQGGAMLAYYRKDLLEKYHLPLPKDWDELAVTVKTIQGGEHNPDLQGLSVQGAPIEGAVCTFLLPYWSQGKNLIDAQGKLTLDREAAVKGLESWLSLVDRGAIKKNLAEIKTADTVNEFKDGRVIFALGWPFAWEFFDKEDSKVRGKIGVLPMPAMPGGESVSCLGGALWGVSAFSQHKEEAAKVALFLSSVEAGRAYATKGSVFPARTAVYSDPEVVQVYPWLKDAAPTALAARERPSVSNYAQVSSVIRTETSAALARISSPRQAVEAIESGLRRILR